LAYKYVYIVTCENNIHVCSQHKMIKFNLQGPRRGCNKAVHITTEVAGPAGSYNHLYNTSTHCVSLPAVRPGVCSC